MIDARRPDRRVLWLRRRRPGPPSNVDGNRAAGEPVQTIVSVPLPPMLIPGLPPPPALPIPGLAAAIEEAGLFETTYLDEQLRIVRGANGALRVFERDDGDETMPTW